MSQAVVQGGIGNIGAVETNVPMVVATAPLVVPVPTFTSTLAVERLEAAVLPQRVRAGSGNSGVVTCISLATPDAEEVDTYTVGLSPETPAES